QARPRAVIGVPLQLCGDDRYAREREDEVTRARELVIRRRGFRIADEEKVLARRRGEIQLGQDETRPDVREGERRVVSVLDDQLEARDARGRQGHRHRAGSTEARGEPPRDERPLRIGAARGQETERPIEEGYAGVEQEPVDAHGRDRKDERVAGRPLAAGETLHGDVFPARRGVLYEEVRPLPRRPVDDPYVGGVGTGAGHVRRGGRGPGGGVGGTRGPAV